MVNEVVSFFTPLFGLLLICIGMSYREETLGFFGGLVMFVYGVIIIINPLSFLSSFENLLLGGVCFGIGAYVVLRTAWEKVQEILNYA